MIVSLLHEPLAAFIVQMILIIASARLVGLLARGIGQPLVIAEIAAGIMLGPSVLGWLSPTAFHVLFPVSTLKLLQEFSQVGLIVFMFLIGLELDPKLLRGRGGASVFISQTSIILPFGFGILLALYYFPRLAPAGVRFLPFMLFVGISMSITAFPVLARILSERRLLRSKIGVIAITCAAFNDVTAWCLLAFVVSIVKADGLRAAAMTTHAALRSARRQPRSADPEHGGGDVRVAALVELYHRAHRHPRPVRRLPLWNHHPQRDGVRIGAG
jgi:Kef-type K+ transport system membrane component KefB